MWNAKKRLILCILLLMVFFIYQKSGPSWITDFGIDPTTYLFFSLIPAIWLFRISSTIIGFIAIILLIITAFFSMTKNDQVAENFAILTFFFFATAVFQQIVSYFQKFRQST